MQFDEYQRASKRTALYPEFGARWVYPALGLASEAGEVADKVKKTIRDHGGVFDDDRRTQLQKELGDVLWYVAQLCSDLGLSLDETAQQNLDKLQSRYQRGQLQGSGDDR